MSTAEWSGGKGSSRRPTLISDDQFSKNWDLIFAKKVEEPVITDEEAECTEGVEDEV